MNKYAFGNDSVVWDPWKGCFKISEGCYNCYVRPTNTFTDLYTPINLTNVKPYTVVTICLHSDFFLEEADHIRPSVWHKIKKYPELLFLIITKRVDRIKNCLPTDWKDGYDNVILCATAENQVHANERLPVFLNTPAKHRWVTCSPMLEKIDLSSYLCTGKIEHVEATGERCCEGAEEIRPTEYNWVKNLSYQCKEADVRFTMQYLGHNFIMPDGSILKDWSRWFCSEPAKNLGLDYYKPIIFHLGNSDVIY